LRDPKKVHHGFAKHNKGDVRAWSSEHYMPRIKTVYGDNPAKIPFDFTEVLAALAPRPVFANARLHDEPDFEVSGVKDCFTATIPDYREVFKAADRWFATRLFPTSKRAHHRRSSRYSRALWFSIRRLSLSRAGRDV
jgi:hypothetical protein